MKSSNLSIEALREENKKLQASSDLLEESNRQISKRHQTESLKAKKNEDLAKKSREKYDALVKKIEDFSHGFEIVEACVHKVRGDGEIFLANLESERRYHEDEIVSSSYQTVNIEEKPRMSSKSVFHAKKSSGAHNKRLSWATSLNGTERLRESTNSEVSQSKDFKRYPSQEKNDSLSTSSRRVISEDHFPQLDSSMQKYPIIPPEQRIAILSVFDRVDQSQSGKVSVRDLTLALRRDPVVAKYLHLPLKIHDSDAHFTTLQHIFNAIDGNHKDTIMAHQLEAYFHVDGNLRHQATVGTSKATKGINSQFSTRSASEPSLEPSAHKEAGSRSLENSTTRVAASRRRIRHSSFSDLSIWPVDLSGSFTLKKALVRSPSSLEQIPLPTKSTKIQGESKIAGVNGENHVIDGEQAERMRNLCQFLSASISHEREVVTQYIARLLDRELHHADIIDSLNFGEGGVENLGARLDESQRNISDMKQQLTESVCKFDKLNEQNKKTSKEMSMLHEQLLAKHEQVEVLQQEKLGAIDREKHLKDDIQGLKHRVDAMRLSQEEFESKMRVSKAKEHHHQNEHNQALSKLSLMEKDQVENLRRISILEDDLKQAKDALENFKVSSEEHQQAHEETKRNLSAELKLHSRTQEELEDKMSELTKERNHLLSEMTRRLHQVEDLKEIVQKKEKLLRGADEALATEVEKRAHLKKNLEDVTAHEQKLRNQLHESQLKCLELSRTNIEAGNEIESWKVKYKESKSESKREGEILSKKYEEAQYQLAQLGMQMMKEAEQMKMVEDEVHSGREAVSSVEAELHDQERKLLEIKDLLGRGKA